MTLEEVFTQIKYPSGYERSMEITPNLIITGINDIGDGPVVGIFE